MILSLKNNHDLTPALLLIKNAQKITLLTHYNPDGDGISACAALAHILEKEGKEIETIYPSKTDETIARQPKNILIGTHKQVPDLIITTDTSVYARLYYPEVFKNIPLINIDHHLNNEIQGTFNFVETAQSSASELLFNLLLHWYPDAIDEYVAHCLLYGILYDTQVFYNQGAFPSSLRAAALLQEKGANMFKLQEELLCNKSPQVMRFWGELLQAISFTKNGAAAYVVISQQMLKDKQLTLSSTVGFSNFLAQLSMIDITVLFYESEDGNTKASLRSKNANVNMLASTFNGGGHKNASGITSKKPLKEFVHDVVEALERL